MIMVVFSGLSIGQMFAVFGYLWYMMGPVQEILNIQYSFYNANAALSRINNLLTLEQEPNYPHTINPFENKNTVSIDISDLRFSYGFQWYGILVWCFSVELCVRYSPSLSRRS